MTASKTTKGAGMNGWTRPALTAMAAIIMFLGGAVLSQSIYGEIERNATAIKENVVEIKSVRACHQKDMREIDKILAKGQVIDSMVVVQLKRVETLLQELKGR